jgi:hypothetical protein
MTEPPAQSGRSSNQHVDRNDGRAASAKRPAREFNSSTGAHRGVRNLATTQVGKGNVMEKSKLLDDQSLLRILMGAVLGAAAMAFVGFNGLGWMLESTAKEAAKASASSAVVEVLAPICAEKFQNAADASNNKVALLKINASEQASFITQGGWAKFPGNNTSHNTAVADACARMISALK